MRVLIKGRAGTFKVVNAETGEPIRGVTCIDMRVDPRGSTLTIQVADFDVEVEGDAEIVPEEVVRVKRIGKPDMTVRL